MSKSSRTVAFSNNPRMKIPRSAFDLSHEYLTTANQQFLYPVMCLAAIPGDVFKLGVTAVIRLQPLVAPILSGMKVRFYDFFVPYRLLWDGFEEFITKGVQGTVATTPPLVYDLVNAQGGTACDAGTLYDYLGFPVNYSTGLNVIPVEASPLLFPIKAYNFIWNNFFRDETLQAEVDLTEQFAVLKRNWSKDYLTSALPFRQRGVPVALPMFGTGSANFDVDFLAGDNNTAPRPLGASFTGGAPNGGLIGFDSQLENGNTAYTIKPNASGTPSQANIKAGFDQALSDGNTIDGSSFTGTDITDLRYAFKVQELMEANARGGVRYTEYLQNIFGIGGDLDVRLQRPEYIGGVTLPVIISEVLQTSSTDNEPTPQGTLAGHGIAVANSAVGSYRVQEFGLVMRLMCITSDALYQNGVNRQWLHRTAYDFPHPLFAGLSEQEIFNEEVFALNEVADPDGSENLDIFGFTGRYNEYRFQPSVVTGKMRDTFAYWTQSRVFSGTQTLDSAFISEIPRKDVFAVPSEDGFIVRVGNHVDAYRPLPFMPVPVSLGGV